MDTSDFIFDAFADRLVRVLTIVSLVVASAAVWWPVPSHVGPGDDVAALQCMGSNTGSGSGPGRDAIERSLRLQHPG